MNRIAEYRRNARECEALAEIVSPEHRQRLLNMAATWEELAADRELELIGQVAGSRVRRSRIEQHIKNRTL